MNNIHNNETSVQKSSENNTELSTMNGNAENRITRETETITPDFSESTDANKLNEDATMKENENIPEEKTKPDVSESADGNKVNEDAILEENENTPVEKTKPDVSESADANKLNEDAILKENKNILEEKTIMPDVSESVDGKKVNEDAIMKENKNIPEEKTIMPDVSGSADGNKVSEDATMKENKNILEENKETDDKINHENTDVDDDIDEDEVETSVYTNKYDGTTSQIPDFAVVYSFLDLFGVYLGLPYVTISDLEQCIDYTKDIGKKGEQGILETLHIKLFRRLNKSTRFGTLSSCQAERLAKVILKFSQMVDLKVSWDLEQFGYHLLNSAQRLIILKHLCEVQFDENVKFRANLQEAYKFDQGASLRLSPYGYEQDGLNVWLHEDKDFNLRVYAGEEDDSTGDTWKVRAGSVEDLEIYISQLKTQTEINPKDTAVEKIKERRIARQLEREINREKKKKEREEKRKAETEKLSKRKSRGRRSKPKKEVSVEEDIEDENEDDNEDEEDDGCARCYENKQSDLVLLCDGCDAAYHTLCLRPPIMTIPEGDWFCPFCLQLKLIEKLQVKHSELRKKLLAKERQSRKLSFYGIRTANILQEANVENGLGRRCAAKKVDYNFSEYDQMMKDAMKSNNRNDSNRSGSDVDAVQPTRKSRREKRKKLNTLSSGDSYSSGSEYGLSESESERRRRNDVKDFLVNDDYDEIEERHRNKYLRRSKRTRDKTRQSNGVRRRYRDDDDDEGGVSSDDSDASGPRRSKRVRKATVYNESNSDDDVSGLKVAKPIDNDEGDWEKIEEDVVEDDEEMSEKEQENDSNSDQKSEQKYSSTKKKKKSRVIQSDEDDDDEEEEVPYDDNESEDEENIEEDEENETDDKEENTENVEEEAETGDKEKKHKVENSTKNEVNIDNGEVRHDKEKELPGLINDIDSALPKKEEVIVENMKQEEVLSKVENNSERNYEQKNIVKNSNSDELLHTSIISDVSRPLPLHQPKPVDPLLSSQLKNFNVQQQPILTKPIRAPAWNSSPNRNLTEHSEMINLPVYSQNQTISSAHKPFTETLPPYYPRGQIQRQYPGMSNPSSPLLPMRPTPTYSFNGGLHPAMQPTSHSMMQQHGGYPDMQHTDNMAVQRSPAHPAMQHTDNMAVQRSALHPAMRPSDRSISSGIPRETSLDPSIHRFPPYRQHQWPGMTPHSNEFYQQTQAVPTNKFYGGRPSSNWSPYAGDHAAAGGYQRSPHPNIVQSDVSSYQYGHDKIKRKQEKEQEKQDKEMLKFQKQLDKDKNRSRQQPASAYHEQQGAKSIGYFKSMVISSDGTQSPESFSTFSPARM